MRLHPWDMKGALCSSLECPVMFSSTCETVRQPETVEWFPETVISTRATNRLEFEWHYWMFLAQKHWRWRIVRPFTLINSEFKLCNEEGQLFWTNILKFHGTDIREHNRQLARVTDSKCWFMLPIPLNGKTIHITI